MTLSPLLDGAEFGTGGKFKLERAVTGSDTIASPLTVNFTVSGSATRGVDYLLSGDTVPQSGDPPLGNTYSFELGANVASAEIPYTVLNDTTSEGWETVKLGLVQSANYNLGTTDAQTSWIEDNELWIEADTDPIVVGQGVTFSLPEEMVEESAVEWDLNYDGTFDAVADEYESWIMTSFNATGPRTVAARVTTNNVAQIVTLAVTVGTAPPAVTQPADLTVNVGTTSTLSVTATTANGPLRYEWSYNFFNDNYEPEYETIPNSDSASISYQFTHAGTYQFGVKVTDQLDKSSEVWFDVTVENVAPQTGITMSLIDNGTTTWTKNLNTETGTIAIGEGNDYTFTVHDIGTDTLDDVGIFVSWTGLDEDYEQLSVDDLTIVDDWTVQFTHEFAKPNSGNLTLKFAVVDSFGYWTEYSATFSVSSQKIQGSFGAGRLINKLEHNNQTYLNLWAIDSFLGLRFDNVKPELDEALSDLVYHWKYKRIEDANWQTETTTTPNFQLPNDPNKADVFDVEAWITGKNGSTSDHTLATVVREGEKLASVGAKEVESIPIFARVQIGGIADSAFYTDFTNQARVEATNLDPNSSVQVIVDWNEKTKEYLDSFQYEYRYTFDYEVWDVEEFTFSQNHNNLIATGQIIQSANPVLAPNVSATPHIVEINHPMALHTDRKIVVRPRVEVLNSAGAVVYSYGLLGTATAYTVKTLSTGQEINQGINAIAQIVEGLGQKGQDLVNYVKSKLDVVFRLLVDGLKTGIADYATYLLAEGGAKKEVIKWLFGGTSALTILNNINGNIFEDGNWKNLLLQYAGITWDHVQDVFRQELGEGHLDALDQVAALFTGEDGNFAGKAQDFLNTLNQAYTDAGGVGELTSSETLYTDLKDKFGGMLLETVGKLGVQIAAKFVPGAGAVLSILNTVTWVIDNKDRFVDLYSKLTEIIDAVNPAAFNGITGQQREQMFIDKTNAIAVKVKGGMEAATSLLLGNLASQFGLGGVPNAIRKAVAFVPTQVDAVLRTLVKTMVKPLKAGANLVANAQLFAGKLGSVYEFDYKGNHYGLWLVRENTMAGLKIAQKVNNEWKLVSKLKASDFTTAHGEGLTGTAISHATDLINKAQEYINSFKKNPSGPKLSLSALKEKLKQLVGRHGANDPVANYSHMDKVVADIQANACKALNLGCFAAGTKLWTESGWRNVEEILAGEKVYSKDQWSPGNVVELREVEEVFKRFAVVQVLHLFSLSRLGFYLTLRCSTCYLNITYLTFPLIGEVSLCLLLSPQTKFHDVNYFKPVG